MKSASTKLGLLELHIPEDKKHIKSKKDGQGATYTGEQNHWGEKEGFGIKKWADGAIYAGMWK